MAHKLVALPVYIPRRDRTCTSNIGGGKTTQVKILAGELQPTAGEVVKSSKDLRVAFLRQEFVDELVMERSLKDELISVFTEEAQVLAELQLCEVRSRTAGFQRCGCLWKCRSRR